MRKIIIPFILVCNGEIIPRGQDSRSRTLQSVIQDRESCPLGWISLSYTRNYNEWFYESRILPFYLCYPVMPLTGRTISIIRSFCSFYLQMFHLLIWNFVNRFIVMSSFILGTTKQFLTELCLMDLEKFQLFIVYVHLSSQRMHLLNW